MKHIFFILSLSLFFIMFCAVMNDKTDYNKIGRMREIIHLFEDGVPIGKCYTIPRTNKMEEWLDLVDDELVVLPPTEEASPEWLEAWKIVHNEITYRSK